MCAPAMAHIRRLVLWQLHMAYTTNVQAWAKKGSLVEVSSVEPTGLQICRALANASSVRPSAWFVTTLPVSSDASGDAAWRRPSLITRS